MKYLVYQIVVTPTNEASWNTFQSRRIDPSSIGYNYWYAGKKKVVSDDHEVVAILFVLPLLLRWSQHPFWSNNNNK